VLAGAGRDADALAVFERALTASGGDLEFAQLRIEALLRLKRYADVLAATGPLLASRPSTPILLHQRGLALAALGRSAEAESCFARVLQIKPDAETALFEQGAALAAQHRIADWFAAYHIFARHNASPWPAPTKSPSKARHDAEQQAWLGGQGIVPDARLHIEGGERLEGPAVNPANADNATRRWNENRPRVVVVDDLLTEEALAALRRFCLNSTIWRTGFEAGYLGAFPEHGFSVPLLAQIAEEFREVFSAICGDLPLKYAWAFTYDSSLPGLHVHADDALVNVNFWITPDQANLDPEHGGLLVWDVESPKNWDFGNFHGNQPAIRDYLAGHKAKAIKVPYRGNRAVIFDSQLLHQTDTVRFRQGYENRRINVTLLYGLR
jgi:hypothetical protein